MLSVQPEGTGCLRGCRLSSVHPSKRGFPVDEGQGRGTGFNPPVGRLLAQGQRGADVAEVQGDLAEPYPVMIEELQPLPPMHLQRFALQAAAIGANGHPRHIVDVHVKTHGSILPRLHDGRHRLAVIARPDG